MAAHRFMWKTAACNSPIPIYEVCAVLDGRLMDEEGHLDRLERSLAALDMHMPMARGALRR